MHYLFKGKLHFTLSVKYIQILPLFLLLGGRLFLCLPSPLQSSHHVDRCVTNRGEKESMCSKCLSYLKNKNFNPGLEKVSCLYNFDLKFLKQNTKRVPFYYFCVLCSEY